MAVKVCGSRAPAGAGNKSPGRLPAGKALAHLSSVGAGRNCQARAFIGHLRATLARPAAPSASFDLGSWKLRSISKCDLISMGSRPAEWFASPLSAGRQAARERGHWKES